MKKEDKPIADNQLKRSRLEERGGITLVYGGKKVTFRHVSVDELKSRRRAAYKYLV